MGELKFYTESELQAALTFPQTTPNFVTLPYQLHTGELKLSLYNSEIRKMLSVFVSVWAKPHTIQ
jgi:hypothetical protein